MATQTCMSNSFTMNVCHNMLALPCYYCGGRRCAAKNYHETLVSHGVSSKLVLQPAPDERCGCVGQKSDPAAADSPYLGWCEKAEVQTDFCHMHVMAFAKMV